MARERQFLREANRLVNAFYRMSGEVQVLACVAVWAHIAILLRLIDLDGGLPSVWEAWIGLLILLVGLLSGPLVAIVSAAVCVVLLSPLGLYAATAGGWGVFAARLALLTTAGLVGGFLKRLIEWMNDTLYETERRVAGTGLPNLKATLEHIEELLKKRQPDGESLDVLNVQLNNLDEIRKTAGREKLDRVLDTFAARLRDALGEGAWVGQLGDSELLGVQSAGEQHADDVHKRLDEVLRRPVDVDGESYDLRASTGLYRSAADADEVTPQKLLEEATRAATRQRPAGGQRQSPAYNAYQDKDSLGQQVSSRQLQAAMENGEIRLLYVPRLNSRSGYFSTLEAIICWRHPQRGALFLKDFRPMLEEESAVQGMELWTLRLALATADQWLDDRHRFRLAMNVTIDERLSAPVLAYLLKEVEQRGSAASWLSIELAQPALIRADDKCLQYLVRLQNSGVSVAVRNFRAEAGVTVQDMVRLPVDTLKLSMRDVDKATAYSEERRRLNSLVRMIHARGLATVAEGIRSRELLRVLRGLHVQELQGPILSQPLAESEIPWGRIR